MLGLSITVCAFDLQLLIYRAWLPGRRGIYLSHPDFKPEQFHVLLDWPVQWADQDAFGHVNNVTYFRWFESARVDYFRHLGLAKLHGEADYGPILAHAACNFRRQIEFPDTVRIGTRATHIGRTSLKLEHALWRTPQELVLAADGSSTVVLFDYKNQRPIPVPDDVRRSIEQLEGRKFELQ
jgi:acyl-CoA thioester hydrolase